MTPIALFVPEATPHGPIFHPANEVATRFTAIAGSAHLNSNQLQQIQALGFKVAETNGQAIPLPHPWKRYQRQVQPEPKHV